MPVPSPLYIILNGPPATGKSTEITRQLTHLFTGIVRVAADSFAAPMKHYIATALGEKYHSLKKNTPYAELAGYTPREFLIHLSEECMKPRYGEDFFGRLLVHRTLRLNPLPDLVIIDDCGFPVEVDALHGYRHRIVRVTRPGCDFTGDSRAYVEDPHYVLENDGSLSELYDKVDALGAWVVHQFPTGLQASLCARTTPTSPAFLHQAFSVKTRFPE